MLRAALFRLNVTAGSTWERGARRQVRIECPAPRSRVIGVGSFRANVTLVRNRWVGVVDHAVAFGVPLFRANVTLVRIECPNSPLTGTRLAMCFAPT